MRALRPRKAGSTEYALAERRCDSCWATGMDASSECKVGAPQQKSVNCRRNKIGMNKERQKARWVGGSWVGA
jgi:hypothetical protein